MKITMWYKTYLLLYYFYTILLGVYKILYILIIIIVQNVYEALVNKLILEN